jgi:membrane protease subunit (stomatin/prohibitin family)
MSQFMEVIEWVDAGSDEIVHRVPEVGSGETKFGAQLIVRDSQAAIFFRDGKGLDVLGPGRHTLSTLNLPILTKVLSLPWGFTSPFRSEVYFVNLKIFTNLHWGTKDPVVFKDRELGVIRLRAFGVFTMRVTQPLLFINAMVGTRGWLNTGDIEDYLREVIVSRFNDFLGENLDSVVALPKVYDELGVGVKARLRDDLRKYGIELVDLLISRITPPEDVQRMIDERSGMEAVGDMDRFLKFKAAKALEEAASGRGVGGGGGGGNGGGTPGSSGPGGAPGGDPVASGLGLGVGAGLGMMIPGMLFKTLAGDPSQGALRCTECHAEVTGDSRFCARCGHQLVVIRKCPRCDKNLTAQANFCPSCGLDLKSELACAKCATKLPPGTKFCFRCGEKLADPEPPPSPSQAQP